MKSKNQTKTDDVEWKVFLESWIDNDVDDAIEAE